MSRVGIYLHGELMTSYPNEVGAYAGILADLKEAVEQTGMIHELRIIKDKLAEEYEEGSGVSIPEEDE